MIKIGITGVMGSGKTTLAGIFREFGIPVIDADEISRNLTKKGTPVFGKIIEYFGRNVVGVDGELNRKKLAEIVFKDKEKRKILEEIVHPAVRNERDKILCQIEAENPDAIVALDIPLLFETGVENTVDYIICAYADEITLYSRIKNRDDMSYEEFSARLKNQISIDEKAKRSHFVIDTRKELAELRAELHAVIKKVSPGFFKD
jgi:dephospho-CoA kinase